MKKFLLFISAVMLTMGVSAQNFKKAAVKLEKGSNPAVVASRPAKAPMALAENQQYMGAFTSDRIDLGLGLTGLPGTYKIATYIPSDMLALYDGGKVVGMRFALSDVTTTTNAFIAYVNSKGEVVTLAEAKIESTVVGWNEVSFDTPFTLDFTAYDNVFIGYDYTQTSKNFPLSVSLDGVVCQTLMYGNFGEGLNWWDTGFSDYGNLCVQAIVEKEYNKNAIAAYPFEDANVQIEKETEAEVYLANTGLEGVSNFDYVVTTDGVAGEEIHYEMKEMVTGLNTFFVVNIPLQAAAEPGTQDIAITITKVNGVENPDKNNVATGQLNTLKRLYQHNVVVEEYTGTTCGYCPIGWQGMENLRAEFGERCVGIAIHQYTNKQTSDAMYINPNNYGKPNFSGSAPMCKIERGKEMNPYGIGELVRAAMKVVAPAGIELQANWNADSTAVVFHATLETKEENQEYDLEFVLIGDGLSGEAGFRQSNYLYTDSPDEYPEDLAKFCKGGKWGTSSVSLTFNDVALASSYKDGKNRLASLGVLTPYEPVDCSLTVDMPTYAKLLTAVQKSGYNVWAAAIIIDKSTKKIVNGVKVKVKEYDPTGIETVVVEKPTNDAIYNIAGQRIDKLQKGINIVNGKKYLVK